MRGGGSSKFEGGGGGLSQNMEEHGEHLKCCRKMKNTCEGVHLIKRLPAISLQVS